MNKSFFQPLDRAAIALILILSVIIGMLLWTGDKSRSRVRDFSWQNQQIGAEDRGFILTFSRPMNHTSVEQNLRIDPPLPGKFSWAGRRMAYTLISPAPYGSEYQLQLLRAKDKFAKDNQPERQIQPFTAKFKTRDRAFAYLGIEGNDAGRLMLVNLSAKEPKPIALTPPDLVVTDFQPYPLGDRILFSANPREFQRQSVLEQQLYVVTTGIAPQSDDSSSGRLEPPGKIKLVLDNKDYQNLKFDLSADGQTIVAQRVSRGNSADFGLWIIKPDGKAKPLKGQPGGDFKIAPDSKAIAIAQGEGLAIVPLDNPGDKPLDFLPKFGTVVGFSNDGTAAAMVKFNTDRTRSLYLVNNTGVEKELFRTTGSILDAQFAPGGKTLYCLLTQLIPGDEFIEEPYIATINLETSQLRTLVVLKNQRQADISLSPDGIALLFDQPVTTIKPAAAQSDAPRTDSGEAIVASRLWLVPLPTGAGEATSVSVQPEQLPLSGFNPHWLP
ncbi:MAG TPA: hypothetical protein DDW76_27595 [Cyanobacteria bacterium UBA11369]|nr:hypothetical protein [Cyanobacteria bacterium UBA11371]HBE36664.1 hypothetical protein [Cyanobacteria bacterium UBA11368]HBE52432.1 hypothetical protein [Cyanobacteria bacterium UBA11369]